VCSLSDEWVQLRFNAGMNIAHIVCTACAVVICQSIKYPSPQFPEMVETAKVSSLTRATHENTDSTEQLINRVTHRDVG